MNIYEVRKALMSGKSIYDLPLRVTYYARVSTEKEQQKNSKLESEIWTSLSQQSVLQLDKKSSRVYISITFTKKPLNTLKLNTFK